MDIICGNIWLLDQVEWDLFCWRNDPEDFAATYCNELGLPAEFKTSISHAIREQSFLFIKSMLSSDYRLEGSNVYFNDPDLNAVASVNVQRVLRTPDVVDNFTPKVVELSLDELEKLIYSRKRENRRKKRSMNSILTPPKTNRTFLGYRGTLHRIMPSEYGEDDDRNEKKSRFLSAVGASMYAANSITPAFGAGATPAAPNKRAPPRRQQMAGMQPVTTCSACSNVLAAADNGICGRCGCCTPNSAEGLAVGNRADQSGSGSGNSSAFGLRAPAKRGRKPLARSPAEVSSAASNASKPDPEPLDPKHQSLVPEWLTIARLRLDEKYPQDLFTVCFDDNELKMKCIECNKIYAVGPHQSLSNFETHLKNRTHRGVVEKRLSDAEAQAENAVDAGRAASTSATGGFSITIGRGYAAAAAAEKAKASNADKIHSVE